MFIPLILLGLLILSPLNNAAETEGRANRTSSRQPRHYRNLESMVSAMTGRPSTDFLFYGRYCGVGGEGGIPVDKIDECCEMHDACYNLFLRTSCARDVNAVYTLRYRFSMDADKMHIQCEESFDQCKNLLCDCDATLSRCLKQNLDDYNEKRVRPISSEDIQKFFEIHETEQSEQEAERRSVSSTS